jgi:hypothetical protein
MSGDRVRELEEKLLELARIHHRSHEGVAPNFRHCSVITCQEVSAVLAVREDTERPDELLRGFVQFIARLDDLDGPGYVARRKITLQKLIDKAKLALAANPVVRDSEQEREPRDGEQAGVHAAVDPSLVAEPWEPQETERQAVKDGNPLPCVNCERSHPWRECDTEAAPVEQQTGLFEHRAHFRVPAAEMPLPGPVEQPQASPVEQMHPLPPSVAEFAAWHAGREQPQEDERRQLDEAAVIIRGLLYNDEDRSQAEIEADATRYLSGRAVRVHEDTPEQELRERMGLIERFAKALGDPACEGDCEGSGIDQEGAEWSLCECALTALQRLEKGELPVHEDTDAEPTEAEVERRVGRESDELDRVEEMSDNDVLAMVGYRMTGEQLRRMGRMVLAAARGEG